MHAVIFFLLLVFVFVYIPTPKHCKNLKTFFLFPLFFAQRFFVFVEYYRRNFYWQQERKPHVPDDLSLTTIDISGGGGNGDDDEPRYECKCGRRFKRLNKWRYHNKWECGKVIQCDICNRVVTTFYSLKMHMKTHNMRRQNNYFEIKFE